MIHPDDKNSRTRGFPQSTWVLPDECWPWVEAVLLKRLAARSNGSLVCGAAGSGDELTGASGQHSNLKNHDSTFLTRPQTKQSAHTQKAPFKAQNIYVSGNTRTGFHDLY